jgi:hypothetical protein
MEPDPVVSAGGAHCPLVSVVIDNYNYERFLSTAIDSALNQTYVRTEVVVVDDGSTDASADVIRGYGSAIRAVFKANGGQGSALNAGVEASRGDIVMFLDADDLLYPNAVDRVVACLGPDDAKAHFRLEVIDGEGRPRGEVQPSQKFALGSGAVLGEVLRRGRYVSAPNSGNAFPRKVIEHLGPVPDRFVKAADTFYIMGAPFVGPVCAIEEVLGAYRQHGGNVWDPSAAHGTPQIPDFGVPLDLARHDLVRDLARRHGLTAGNRPMTFSDPNHMVARLASLREHTPTGADRTGVAGPSERPTRLALLAEGFRAVLSVDGGRLLRRLGLSCVLVAMATLPERGALRVAGWYLNPASRPSRRLAHRDRPGRTLWSDRLPGRPRTG